MCWVIECLSNADRAVKDNCRTLDQPFDIYPTPEDVVIDKLEQQILEEHG